MVTSNMNLIYSYLIYPIERTYYRLRGCNLREVGRSLVLCVRHFREIHWSSEGTMEGDLSRLFDAKTRADFVRIAYPPLETYFFSMYLTLQRG